MFRFTIRDVLLLTAIAALVIGWVIDHSRLAQSNSELLTQRNRLADTKTQWVVQRERLQQKMRQADSDANDAK
jgi:hypothetical protein